MSQGAARSNIEAEVIEEEEAIEAVTIITSKTLKILHTMAEEVQAEVSGRTVRRRSTTVIMILLRRMITTIYHKLIRSFSRRTKNKLTNDQADMFVFLITLTKKIVTGV
jgi:hypothetical protein